MITRPLPAKLSAVVTANFVLEVGGMGDTPREAWLSLWYHHLCAHETPENFQLQKEAQGHRAMRVSVEVIP